MHYRAAPERQSEIRSLAEGLVRREPALRLIVGKMVVEFQPAGSDKGAAIAAFLAEPPFAGRAPIFIGDDVTDEDGFAEVSRRGGIAIRVGPQRPSPGRLRAAECSGCSSLACDRLIGKLKPQYRRNIDCPLTFPKERRRGTKDDRERNHGALDCALSIIGENLVPRHVASNNRRLVVVSNRVAVESPKPDSGGLAIAIRAALETSGGIWFGWSGRVTDNAVGEPETIAQGSLTCATLDLSQRDFDEYYLGYRQSRALAIISYAEPAGRLFAARLCRVFARQSDVCTGSDADVAAAGSGLGPRLPFDSARARNFANSIRRSRSVFSCIRRFRRPSFSACCRNHRDLAEACAPMIWSVFRPNRISRFSRLSVALGRGERSRRVACSAPSGASCARRCFRSASMSRRSPRKPAQPTAAATCVACGKAWETGPDDRRRPARLLERVAGALCGLFALAGNLSRNPRSHRVHADRAAVALRGSGISGDPRISSPRRPAKSTAATANLTGRRCATSTRASVTTILTGFFRAGRIGLVTPLRDGMNLVAKEYVASQPPDGSGGSGIVVLCRCGPVNLGRR